MTTAGEAPAEPEASIEEAPEALDRKAIRRQVLLLAGPAIAQSLVQMAVFFIDRLFLGRYSEEAIAAMQIAGPTNWTIFSLLSAFNVGAVAAVARATGAGQLDEAKRAAAAALLFGLAGGLFALGLLPLLPGLIGLYQAAPAAEAGSYAYLSSVLPAYPLFCTGLTIAAIMTARGDTRTPFVVGVIADLVNVSLNGILIFGAFGAPELGVQGAGIATAIAWGVQSVLLIALIGYGKARLFEGLGEVAAFVNRGTIAAARRIAKVSLPALAERAVFHAGFLIFAGLITQLGIAAMAANQAAISIESLSFTTSNAIGVAAAAVVGQRLGARDFEGASLGGLEAMKIALLILGGAGLIYLAFARFLVGLFVESEAVIALGATAMMICALEQPGMAVADVIGNALRGAGDTRSPMLVTMICVWAVRVLGTYLAVAVFDWGLLAVWAVTAIEWTARGGALLIIFRRGRWRSIEL